MSDGDALEVKRGVEKGVLLCVGSWMLGFALFKMGRLNIGLVFEIFTTLP